MQNYFKKAGRSEQAVEVALDDPDDPFKDITAEDDMELDEIIEGLRTKLPEEVPLRCNAAALLEINEEIATSGDKPTDADILAFIRGGSPSNEEEEDKSEIEDKPPACPASFEVDKAVESLQQFTLFCDNGVEIREMVEKINMVAKNEFSGRKKQSTIPDIFKQL